MFKFCSYAYNLSASAVKLQKLYSRQRQKMCDLCSHVSMLTLPYKNACNCKATKDSVKFSTAVALFGFVLVFTFSLHFFPNRSPFLRDLLVCYGSTDIPIVMMLIW